MNSFLRQSRTFLNSGLKRRFLSLQTVKPRDFSVFRGGLANQWSSFRHKDSLTWINENQELIRYSRRTFQGQNVLKTGTEVVRLSVKLVEAYKKLTKFPELNQQPAKMTSLLRYNDKKTIVDIPLIEGGISPYCYLLEKAVELVPEYSKRQFNMYLSSNGHQYVILDDTNFIDMLKRGGGIDERVEITIERGVDVKGDSQLASEAKAYDYITTRAYTENMPQTQLESYQAEIEDFVVGQHTTDATAWGADGIQEDQLVDSMLQLAEQYKWGEKILAGIKAIPFMDQQCSADVQTSFENGVINSRYVRFYAWRNLGISGGEKKFSIRVTTSNLIYDVPKEQIESADWKTWFTKGGGIKNKTMKTIETVMEDRAFQAARHQIPDPRRQLKH